MRTSTCVLVLLQVPSLVQAHRIQSFDKGSGELTAVQFPNFPAPGGGGGFPPPGAPPPGGGGGGFPGGGGGGFPGGGGGGGSGGMPSMPGGFPDMDELVGCAQKTQDTCCSDVAFNTDLCVPTHWCMVAIGKLPTGAAPGCPYATVGDASKCKDDDPTVRSKVKMAYEQCTKQLQDLYDKQSSLLDCAHSAAMCKADTDAENAKTSELVAEEQGCKTGQQGGSVDSMQKKSRHFCSNIEVLVAPMRALGEAQIACLESQFPKIEIPDIQIDIPDIDVGTFGNVSSPDFEVTVTVPEFSIPDIVVPGGGGALNVEVQGEPITFDMRMATVQRQIDTCEASKSKCSSAKKAATSSRVEHEQKKEDACKQSLVQVQGHDEDKQFVIGMLEAQKTNFFFTKCADVSMQIDVVITAIGECKACDATCERKLQEEDAVAEAASKQKKSSAAAEDKSPREAAAEDKSPREAAAEDKKNSAASLSACSAVAVAALMSQV